MLRLNSADLRLVLDAIRELYAETDVAVLREKMVRVAGRLVACDLGSYNAWGRNHTRMTYALRFPDSADIRRVFPAFEAHLGEHPVIPRIRDGKVRAPMKFSDYVDLRQLNRLGIYNEYFRVIGVRHQMVSAFDPDDRMIKAVSLNRGGRDFSERDRQVIHLLQPHFGQAYANAAAICRLRKATAAMDGVQAARAQAMILVDRASQVQWFSPQADAWAREFLQTGLESGSILPSALSSWVATVRQRRAAAQDAIEQNPPELRFTASAGNLSIRYTAEDSDGNVSLLLTRSRPAAPVAVRFSHLTSRENEVLGWIARGKANPEIAIILGRSVRTVHKHVENILSKLDAENRSEAMLRALDSERAC